MGLIEKFKTGYEAFKNAERIAHQPAVDAAVDAAKRKPITDANAVADYLESVKKGERGAENSTRAAGNGVGKPPTSAPPVAAPMTPGFGGAVGGIMGFANHLPNWIKKPLVATALGYGLFVDNPFTPGTEGMAIQTGKQLYGVVEGKPQAEIKQQVSQAKQSEQLVSAQQGSVAVAQKAGRAFLTGETPHVSIDQAATKFGSLIKSQISTTADSITTYETRFKSILQEQIDQNKDSMLQPAEGKGLASSQSFIGLINELPMDDNQKAYVASQTLAMSGYK